MTKYSGHFNDSSARTLAAGDLETVFLPSYGMLGASLRYRGAEILRRVEDLEAAAARGSTAGIRVNALRDAAKLRALK